MGLKCRISYRNGVAEVTQQNGQPSELYQRLLAYAGNQVEALDMWATAYSPEFGRKGENAKVEDIVKFLDSTAATKESLTPSQKMQVKDFMNRNNIKTLDELNVKMSRIFKKNGIFEIDIQEAINSGLYSKEEVMTLDPAYVQDMLLKIEGHLINDNFYVETSEQEDLYKDSSRRTVFGTYERVTQNEIDNEIIKSVKNFTDIENFYSSIKNLPYEDFINKFLEDDEFANTIINRFKDLKKIPKLSFVNGQLSSENNKTYTTITNTIPSEVNIVSVEADIDYLNGIDQDIWEQNPELIKNLLKEVEKSFLDNNIDVIGIADFPGDRTSVMQVLDNALAMAQNPTPENIKAFSDVYDKLTEVEDSTIVENLPSEYTGYNIVKLFTDKSEGELFDKHGLIKVGDNLYHKVNEKVNTNDLVEYIYEEVQAKRLSIPSEFSLAKDKENKVEVLEDITRFLMSRKVPTDLENKQAYSAYQVIFNHLPMPDRVEDVRAISSVKNDEDYLRTKFVGEFYNYILNEKYKRSPLYKNILSKFEITDRDIVLTDTIPSIEDIELKDKLEDYIRLKKDSNMKYLVDTKNDVISEDFLYMNFPDAKIDFEGDAIIAGDFAIVSPTSDNYIKIGSQLYKKGLVNENAQLFVKVEPKSNPSYYTAIKAIEFNRTLAFQILDQYSGVKPNQIDRTAFGNVISKSRLNDFVRIDLKELSTLTDPSYKFFEINDSIVAFKDGVRVGAIRATKTDKGFADEQITVSEIHRGKGIATELYLRFFDKLGKEGKVFYPAEIRTKAAQSIFSRLENKLAINQDGSYSLKPYSTNVRFQVSGWHGSPYSFEKFTTSEIGTGEGAQAFGWGLYFTDLESIARNYADVILKNKITGGNEDVFNKEGEEFLRHAYVNGLKDMSLSDLKESYYELYPIRRPLPKSEEIAIYGDSYNEIIEYRKLQEDTYNKRKEEVTNELNKFSRNLYKVSLHKGKTPSEYTWLEWDKPVSESIYEQLNEIIRPKNQTGAQLYASISETLGGDKNASEYLLDLGIDGIKYPAESLSRGATSDTARGFNYVVFDENAVEIEERIQFSQQATTIKDLQIIPREAFSAIVDRLKLSGLTKGEVFSDRDSFNKALASANAQNKSNASAQDIAGFILGDNVYINPAMLNFNSPIHEYGHLWVSWAKNVRPDLYSKGANLVKDSEYYNNIAERSKDKNSVYFGYSEEAIIEEALATAIGNKGESFVNKSKFEEFKQFLINLWESVKNALGLNQMTPDQISNLSLEQFAEAAAIDLLKGEKFETTTYTIQALLDPMLASKDGKVVNIQTINQILNQPSTKQIEKEIIREVLDLEGFKGKEKIPYNDFKSEVAARIMPLKVIESTSYATYGQERTGVKPSKMVTKIYNTDLDHGVRGHFNADFSGEYIDFDIVELQGQFAVTRKGVAITQENLQDNVFTVTSTREQAQKWISNYDSSKSINRGLFGHTRVWFDGEDVYLAEVQSDSYQKTKAKDLAITSYMNGTTKINEGQKELFDKIKELKEVISNVNSNKGEYKNIKDLSKDIKEKIEYIDRLKANIAHHEDIISTSNDENYKQSLEKLKNREKLAKEGLNQLIRIAKGEEVVLGEPIDWDESYPGSKNGQYAAIELGADSINLLKKNTTTFSLETSKDKLEYGLTKTSNRGVKPSLISRNNPSVIIKGLDAIETMMDELNLIKEDFDTRGIRIYNYKELESILSDLFSSNTIVYKDLKQAIIKQFPNISERGYEGTMQLEMDLGLDRLPLIEKSRRDQVEVDRRIAKLKEALNEVRNNRDYEELTKEIEKLQEYGLLSDEEIAKLESLKEQGDILKEEIRLFRTIDLASTIQVLDEIPEDLKIKMQDRVKTVYNIDSNNYLKLDDAFEYYKSKILPDISVNPERYLEYFEASRNLPKLEDKFIEKADTNIKQFVAHRKNYTTRLLREEFRKNAEDGLKTLSIPTPRTLALIEGYSIDSEDNLPYRVLNGSEDDGLLAGDRIDYGGEEYIVIEADEYSFDATPSNEVTWIDVDNFVSEMLYEDTYEIVSEVYASIDSTKAYTMKELYSISGFEYNPLNKLSILDFEKLKIDNSERFDVDSYDDGKTWEIRDIDTNEVYGSYTTEEEANSDLENNPKFIVYTMEESELRDVFFDSEYSRIDKKEYIESFYTIYAEDGGNYLVGDGYVNSINLLQPSEYDQLASVDTFDPTQLSEEQQTVIRKYEELIDLFRKERPDAEIVEDGKGNQWYRTNLTEEDGKKPVVVFQEAPNRVANPLESIENVSSIFDSQLELLDLYSPKEEAEIIKDIDSCGI